jgi:hypothetical protein
MPPLLRDAPAADFETATDLGNGMGQERTRDLIRMQCRDQLEACVADPASAMTKRDMEEYMKGLDEGNLNRPGLETEDQKTEAVRDLAGRYAQQFIQQTKAAGREAMRIIAEAEGKKWILHSSADEWRDRLKNEESLWPEKRRFIERELPRFSRNWEEIARDFQKVMTMEKAAGLSAEETRSTPELAAIHSSDFRSGKLKYPDRRDRVDKAIAFLAAHAKNSGKAGKETGMKALYAKAKAKLEQAAKDGVLSPQKVGSWLRRIFESKAKPELITKFLNDEGPTPLTKLINNWREVKNRFDKIEEKRGKEGTPRTFHFVHLSLFLSWDYEKRKAYVEEANRRFTDIEKERYNFLKIRHALDTKDWEEAEGLLKTEWLKVGAMTKEDREKLVSMEQFLKTHRPAQAKEGEKRTPTDRELVGQMRSLLGHIPASYRHLHASALRRGYGTFWTNCTVWYNRVWCHEHNWANRKIENRRNEEAKEYTPPRTKEGHGKAFEANRVTGATNEKAAIRDQESVSKPQWLYIGQDSASTLVDTFQRQQGNRKFWYWTSVIPDGVPYETHQYIVKVIHPQMKRLSRELDKRRILFTDSGEVEYQSGAPGPKPSEN